MRVLVDTGIGNGKQRANPAWDNLDTRYLERLTGAGFAPETVDLVILTHLHTDHVGWNTRSDGASWVPTFPHARYVSARAEWDYWAGADMEEARRQMFRDSVDPVEEAGLLDLVHVPYEGAVIAPGVRLLPTPATRRARWRSSCAARGGRAHHRRLHPSPRADARPQPGQLCRYRSRARGQDASADPRLTGRYPDLAPRQPLPAAHSRPCGRPGRLLPVGLIAAPASGGGWVFAVNYHGLGRTGPTPADLRQRCLLPVGCPWWAGTWCAPGVCPKVRWKTSMNALADDQPH